MLFRSMTLTGSLPMDQGAAVQLALSDAYARAVPPKPAVIDRIALFKQDTRAGRFRLLDSFPLA